MLFSQHNFTALINLAVPVPDHSLGLFLHCPKLNMVWLTDHQQDAFPLVGVL